MKSWRESTSQVIQDMMDSMFEQGLNYAGNFLAKYKEFYPFAGAINKKGEYVPIMAYEGNENPSSQDLIDLIIEGFQVDKSKYQAIMIVSDVKINKVSDAISIHMEHESGLVLSMIVPYSFKGVFIKKLSIDMNSAALNKAANKIF